MPRSRLEETVQSLEPPTLLDVGCGCGRHLTSRLPRHCARVVAIDVISSRSAWRELASAHGIDFSRMDATALAFPSDTFGLVLARDALHHISRWPDALAEMIRVSSGHLLIEEPVDELRSPAKQRTYVAQELFLELQAEVGYSHYLHLNVETLLSDIRHRARLLDVQLQRSDEAIAFDQYFDSYAELASRSEREDYWLHRLKELRLRFAGAALCEDDRLTVLAAKSR